MSVYPFNAYVPAMDDETGLITSATKVL